MFANRFTVLIDACSLVDVLGRNIMLSLAEADFFRVRWSVKILDETEKALSEIFKSRMFEKPDDLAKRQRRNMEKAFEDATVEGFERFIPCFPDMPDQGDAHVIAAAIRTGASVIVTENQRHFPDALLGPLDIETKSADAFMADTIGLDTGRAVAAIRTMRMRFNKPEKTAETLLLDLESMGFTETVDVLGEHMQSL